MKVYQGDTFSKLYKDVLIDLMQTPQFETNPRGDKINENINVSLVLSNPLSCLYKNEFRSTKLKYCSAELL